MDINSISFEGRKQRRRLSDKPNRRIHLSNNSAKQVNFSSPDNYEIYIRPYSKENTIIGELAKDTYTPGANKKSTQDAESKNKTKEPELPKEINDAIDAVFDEDTADEKEIKKTSKAKKITKKLAAVIYSLILVAGSIFGTSYGKDKINEVPQSTIVDIKDSKDIRLEDIADAYNADKDMVKYVNDIDEESDLAQINEIKVPSKYDYIDDVASKLEDKLYKEDNLDTDKIIEYGDKIDALIKKQEEQLKIATTYTDGEFVYIKLKDFSKNPELQEEYGGVNLTDDYINELFDIKDGELRKYNTFISTRNEKDGSVMVPTGTIIKVPKASIDMENIKLDKYKEK